MRMRQIYFFIIALLPALLTAQGWQRYYGGERIFSLQALPDGSLVAAGSVSNNGQSDWYWLHTDALGNVLSEQIFGASSQNEGAQCLFPTANGWQLFGGTDTIFSATTDAAGNPQSFDTHLGGTLYNGHGAPNGDVFLCGSDPFSKSLCAKLDAAGQLLWSRSDSLGLNNIGRDMLPLANGEVWLLGSYVRESPNLNSDLFLLKINNLGELISSKTYLWPDEETPSSIVQQTADQWLIIGSVQNASNPAYLDEDLALFAIDASGDSIWQRHIPLTGYQQAHAAQVLANGHLIIAGETRPTFLGSRDAFLARTDEAGNLLWYKTYGGIRGDIFWDVEAMPDGGFALAGQTASFGDGSLKAWLVRTDSSGNVWQNHITGQVFYDVVQNCQLDTDELPLANWLIAADGEAGRYYTTSDANGFYDITVDTGLWAISVLPVSGYWGACYDAVEVLFEDFGDTTTLDFPVQAAYLCPLMQVDLTTPFLRRCFENTYTVRYENYGTVAAENVRIAVIPDPYLTPVSSTLPYTTSGDTLLFEVGAVEILQGGSFAFTALLDCDSTVLGQAHCTEAFIMPDSLCYAIDPIWDGASLNVDGYCAGDSVVLIISNTGSDMQNPVSYVITEDQVIFRQASLLLGAGQDTVIVLYPGGATVGFLLQQTEGYPGASAPMLVIEGCGDFPYSTGYAFQFPTDDGDPFRDMECRTNIGSFDPNDKTGLPEGVDDAHYIAAGTFIEYLIRFQNTGTDSAFRVEIRDTLPQELDLTTLEPGAGSHAHRLQVEGQGVLRFIFDPIVLPDSLSDFAASQGFVKYRIATKKALADGTQIKNRAAIYFDFNALVLTAPTLHTIGNPFNYLLVDATEAPPAGSGIGTLKASPNPFRETTLLEWPEGKSGVPYQIQIWNAAGRLLREATSAKAAYLLHVNEVKENILIIRVLQSGKVIATGKVLRQ